MDKSRIIDDTIQVTNINKDGKFFEKGKLLFLFRRLLLTTILIVSRIEARSEVNKLEIELDVNTDIYPMENGAHYAMVITTSLTQDASEDFDIFQYMNEGSGSTISSLLDEY